LLLSGVAITIIGAALGTDALPPAVIIGGLAIAVVLAIVSGLPPAVRAQRLNIVDALSAR
jgi:putative ABC transport system permease protein